MAAYFTSPIQRPAIWGGTLLKEYFHYPWFRDDIGQSWSFSGQKDASNLIENGIYQGKTLREMWQEAPHLFNSRFSELPVIISLVAPMEDLSIQIHPDSAIAREAGYTMGKNEAWYFLEAAEGAEIVYGHHARDEDELCRYIADDRWDELVDHLPVRRGDFVYLPAGILHALRKGSIVYEIQQATDITYRFYDYHRKDASGSERPLHLQQAIRCIDYSLSQKDAHPEEAAKTLAHATVTTYIQNSSFCVRKVEVNGEQLLSFEKYHLFTIVGGSGTVDGTEVGIGRNFLLPAGEKMILNGMMTLMATCEGV